MRTDPIFCSTRPDAWLRALLLCCAGLLLCALGWPGAAQAQYLGESRLALVIGNSSYRNSPLANPVNDARLMEAALKQAGFEVIKAENASLRDTRRLVRDFGDKLKQRGGVGLFYFAGHGVQVRGENYLVSVDSDIRNEDEVAEDALNAQLVLEKMQSAGNRVNLVILDACRNNPFAVRSRSSGSGLATMNAPSGSMVAYSTAPGSVASDGTGQNGLYTQHLARVISQPGLPVEEVFKQVRTRVRQDSNGQQTPWENTALEGQFYFRPPLQAPVPGVPGATTEAVRPPVLDTTQLELSFWDAVKNSGSIDELQNYVSRFPAGVFAELARTRIASLRAAAARPVAGNTPAPAPPLVPVAPPVGVTATQPTVPPAVPAPKPSVPGAVLAAILHPPSDRAPAGVASPALPTAPVAASPARQGDFMAGTTRFIGQFTQDADGRNWSGTGKVVWANGDTFEGTLVSGKRQGRGKFKWQEGEYDGEWTNDRPQGHGTLTFSNGNHYVGAVVEGLPNGEGFMKYASGDSYRGSFVNGLPHGRGAFDWGSGQRYEGDWQMDRPQGSGTLRFANGNLYEGAVADGVPNGQGSMRYASGDSYTGSFRNGVPDGRGVFTWKNGDQYNGQWRAGAKDGDGVFVWGNGDRWEGVFRNDQQTDSGRLIRKTL